MSYSLCFSLNLGSSHSGQAANLRAQKYTTAGATSGSAISTGFSEVRTGSGRYIWTPGANIADSFRGAVELYLVGSETTVGGLYAINPEEGFNLDTLVSTRATPADISGDLITGSSFVVVSPVVDLAYLKLVPGDDYLTADGRQLDFTDSANRWPTLTSATVVMSVTDSHNHALLTKSGTITTATGSSKSVRFQMTATDTALFDQGTNQAFAIVATLADTTTATLAKGPLFGDSPGLF